MNSNDHHIRLLNAENWHTWRVDIKVLLMDRGCYSFITGTEPVFDPEKATRKEKVEYTTRSDRAFTTIYYAIEEQYRSLLADTTDGKIAYGILKDYFEPSTRARIISLLD